MAPVLLKRYFNILEYPLDFNLKWKGKPLLGPNKTIRGFVGGIIFSMAIIDIQGRLFIYEPFYTLSWIKYPNYNTLLLGFIIGVGVMLGDAAKSFVKRRLNIKPGSSFFPWDQLDGAIGALILVSLRYRIPISIILSVLILAFILHLLISWVGVALGLKETQ
jgi:CDP-2,3-bis-(O-geranylgeranyl)-sn-glycerol synthase